MPGSIRPEDSISRAPSFISTPHEPIPTYHPAFASDAAHIILHSANGTLFRVHAVTLRTTCGFFEEMFANSSEHAGPAEDVVVAVDESDAVLHKFLQIINCLELPKWESCFDVWNVLRVADKYEAPGAVAILRAAVNSPLFFDDPIYMYAVSTQHDWEEESKLASKLSLTLRLHEPAHQELLATVPSNYLVQLYNLHRRRIDKFRRLIDDRFAKWDDPALRCSCSQPLAPNYVFRDLKAAMLKEIERRPLGDTLLGMEMANLPQARELWHFKCVKCSKALFDRDFTLSTVKACIDSLPSTI
jgi:hypothetical protein